MAYEDIVTERNLSSELSQLVRTTDSRDMSDGAMNLDSIKSMTNRLLGSPFQLLDSVDRRFDEINPFLGNEYLRNFMLNSPILYIKPGMPKYTGKDSGKILGAIRNAYAASASGVMDVMDSLYSDVVSNLPGISAGSKLQKRMFGLRETYYDYMCNVNYMCRSVAEYMGLTEPGSFPDFAFGSGSSPASLKSFRWENYRMMNNETVATSAEYLKQMASTTFLNVSVSAIDELLGIGGTSNDDLSIDAATRGNDPDNDNTTLYDIMTGKTTTVQFMVEPVSFEETYNNETDKSFIEQAIDGISTGIGSEVAYITNSGADQSLLGDLTSFLGNSLSDASQELSKLIQPVTGGFLSNLFSGAIRSIKGQKMIYPDIYKYSKSSMDFQYTMTLSTPYGDMYNYYMNIIVPLMHILALVCPRMVSANTISSPFLVQSYIPGMSTCQMGIISSLNITKNPTTKHVSVNGYPLTVKVTFTIKELYNAMAISPINDPASFMFNETLNDYLCNISGLIPSQETYQRQRLNAMQNANEFFENWEESWLPRGTEAIENAILATI